MALVVNRSDFYPVGTSVGVWPRVARASSGPPAGAAIETAVVAHNGSLTFTGLTAGELYVLYANVGGEDRYLAVAEAPASSVNVTAGVSSVDGLTGAIDLTKLAVTAKKQEASEASGAFKGDLSSGTRVFVVKGSGALTLEPPVNAPSTEQVLYVEYRVRTTYALTTSGFTWQGEEPAWSTTGAVNTLQAFSDDGGATWTAIGAEPIPASVARVVGTPSTGQGLVWNGAAWEPTNVSSGGLSHGEVATQLKEEAVTNGGSPLQIIGGTAGQVLVMASSSHAHAVEPGEIELLQRDNGARAGGFIAQSVDLPAGKAAVPAKSILLAKIPLPTPTVKVKYLMVSVAKAGAGLTLGVISLIAPNGELLAVSSNDNVAFESTGIKKYNFSSEPSISSAVGWVWGAVLVVGTTMPELLCAAYAGANHELNTQLEAATVRCGEGIPSGGSAGATAAMAAIVPANNRGTVVDFPLFWFGIA